MPKPARATSARVAANPRLQSALPLRPNAEEHLDISTLEQWLWDAACEIRGATDAPKFKDFILPLVFFKRLSDVFDNEFAAYAKINSMQLGSILLLKPSLPELEAIAEVLTACDAKIAALGRESALLDELFRALLEELMTGRTSVAGGQLRMKGCCP